MLDPAEQRLHRSIQNTAFDDYFVDRYPGLLGVHCITEDMQQQLPEVSANCWSMVNDNLAQTRLNRLQRFWVFLRIGGYTGT